MSSRLESCVPIKTAAKHILKVCGGRGTLTFEETLCFLSDFLTIVVSYSERSLRKYGNLSESHFAKGKVLIQTKDTGASLTFYTNMHY